MSKVIDLLNLLEKALEQNKVRVEKGVVSNIIGYDMNHSYNIDTHKGHGLSSETTSLNITNTVTREEDKAPESKTILTVSLQYREAEKVDLEQLEGYNGLERLFELLEGRIEKQREEAVEAAIDALNGLL